MYDFFLNEFKSLRAKTGIRQWEALNDLPDAAKEIHVIIDLMCRECAKSPFNIIQEDVKQRVIARAIIEDEHFIGLNAKFVRRALNAYWKDNGDRVLEKMNQKTAEETTRVELTQEQTAKIDEMANRYVAELLQGEGPKAVPQLKPDEIKREGAEWQSNLERKSTGYKPVLTAEQIAIRDKIRRAASEFYKDKYSFSGMQVWKVGEYEVFAESFEDAKEIIKQAVI